MKKVFLITTIVLSSCMLSAQHVELGLKGGLNVSTVHGSNSSYNYTYDPRISVHIGGLAHIHLTREFAIQPEIVFSGQGFRTGNNDVYGLNYLNLPVLAQYMFNSGFRIETGPQAGILLNANYTHGTVKQDIKSSYRDVDFSWVFGAGYLMPSGLGFDARFNAGLVKLNDNESPKSTGGVFQAGIFYQFKAMKHR